MPLTKAEREEINKKAKEADSSASSSAPAAATATSPSVASPAKGGGRYTEDLVRQEWSQAGLGTPITQADINNWMRHGKPGQLLYENKGGFRDAGVTEDGFLVQQSKNITRFMEKDKKGNYTKVAHTKYENFDPNIKYWVRGGQGVELGGDWGAQLGERSSRMKFSREKGRFFLSKAVESHGVLGALDDVIGTNIEDAFEKIVPKEVVALSSLTGGTINRLIAGEDFNRRGLEKGAELTGLRPEEIDQYGKMVQQVAATIVGSVFAAPTGGASLLLPAAVSGADYVSQDLSGMDVDWAHAGTDVGIQVAAAVVPGGNIGRTAVRFGGDIAMGADWEDAAVNAGINTVADFAGKGSAMKTAYIEGGLRYAQTGEIEDAIYTIGAAAATSYVDKVRGVEVDPSRKDETGKQYIARLIEDVKNPSSPIDYGGIKDQFGRGDSYPRRKVFKDYPRSRFDNPEYEEKYPQVDWHTYRSGAMQDWEMNR